ncbi:DUF6119 family protein [Actinoplanes sp. CA-030573]|uniref:DUF6119 family protein n=1 Tax=Actinoplanes sp. CA-030573 TaxID=3239898 RepID=UPI003D8AA69A
MDTTITLYKLRDSLDRESWGLRASADSYKKLETRPIDGVDAQLLVKYAEPKAPEWQEDLLSIADHADLSKLQNGATGALLLVKFKDYRFIIAYGVGRHAIESDSIEQGFGLRVAASVIEPTRIRAAFTRKPGAHGRTSYVAMPEAGPLYHLGIEPSEDLIREMEGKPAEAFGRGVSGGDTLRLSVKDFSLRGLGPKLKEVVDAYLSDKYRVHYPFIDYYRRLNRGEVTLRSTLDEMLESQILAPSNTVDYGSPVSDPRLLPDYYVLRYKSSYSSRMTYLDSDNVTAKLATWGVRHPLSEVKVLGLLENAEGPISEHRLRAYTVAEISLDGRSYAISEGSWYEIDANNLESIERALSLIPELDPKAIGIRPWQPKHRIEGHYNRDLARWCGGTLMDAKNFMIGGPHQKIEVCDVLSPQRDLICVKKATSASELSHLFSQGLTSAQLLVRDFEGYRDRVRAHLVPSEAGLPFDRGQWRIVYAIATRKPGPLRRSLFFFSKINLERTAVLLRDIGIDVAVVRIPYMQSNEQLTIF